MTDNDIRNLKSGDRIRVTCNGRRHEVEITEVRKVIRCVNENSGAFNHYGATLSWKYPSGLEVDTSIQSDEYTRGEGYLTHDDNGKRVTGYELLT